MNRRSFLTRVAGAAGAGATLALAGCTALFDASLPDELEGVDPDPDQLPAPAIGTGPTTVEIYEDFGCPTCHEFRADVFPVLEREVLESGAATIQHVDFPLPADDRSVAMANAARAVQNGTLTDEDPAGEFFAYQEAVIGADDWSDEGLADLAADEFGVPWDDVADALEAETYYPTIAADWNRGDENGVDRTPTVFVAGEAVDDPMDADAIVSRIEDADGT